MSYIHEALKKAQREKDALTGKYTHIWSGARIGEAMFRKNWVATVCIVLVAFVFSAYSWIQSLDELAASSHVHVQSSSMTAHRGKVVPPTPPAASKPSKSTTGKVPSSSSVPTRHAVKPSMTPPVNKIQKPKEKSAKAVGAVFPGKNPAASKVPSKKIIARKPKPTANTANSLYDQALALQKKGNLDAAKKLYEAALIKTPNLVSALNNLGTVYIQQHLFDDARRVLEKAVRIDPRYVDAYYNLACLHAQKKDVSRGIFYLKKSIALEPKVREWAKGDNDLMNLRDHTEYEEILRSDQTS